jgi:CheY-like chemotaxis protein
MTRVLVVDDAPDLRLLICGVLAQVGAETTEAGSGPEALRLLRDEPRPDVVILDVQMPDMDGWETLEAIRRLDAEVGVILCTVKAGPEDMARAWALGCDAYLRKPFDIQELAATTLQVARLGGWARATQRRRGLAAARRQAQRVS